MQIVDVWADVVCPFTHVGLRRLTDRRDASGSATRFRARAWPLELVNGAPLPAAKVAEEIAALRVDVAPDLFAGFDPDRFPTTSVPALALTALAYDAGIETGERVALAIRHALFERGLDVGDPSVLAGIADAHGLDPRAADPGAVEREYAAGRAAGVVGSPYFVLAEGGYFCPSLDIAHEAGRFVVRFDRTAFEEFVERALG
ncbi:MAG: DsbA family oxidoreductase [Acidimicrobiia bacterium]